MKDIQRKRKLIILFGISLFVIVTMGISTPAMATLPSWPWGNLFLPTVHVQADQGTLPVIIDGNFSPLEWGDALGGWNIRLTVPSNPADYVEGRLLVKHDGTDLYFLLLIDVAFPSSNNIYIGFDTDGDGTLHNSDDVLYWDRSISPGTFRDLFYSGDALTLDTTYSGTNDGAAAQQVYTGPGEGYTAIEFSHPLDSSDDAHDFSLNSLPETINFQIAFYYQGIDYDGYSYIWPNTGLYPLDVNAGSSLPCSDLDGDTVCDSFDNCPNDYNPGQEDDDQDGSGNACDTDLDNDGILNGPDTCETVFDSGNDSDDDGIDDACDNCRYVDNTGQEDTDGDLLGDACDNPDPEEGIENEITDPLPNSTFYRGVPFNVTAKIINNTGQALRTLRPDCYNTYWIFPGAQPLCRKGPAYGIGKPTDMVTIPDGDSVDVTCDLNDLFESFPPDGGPYEVKAIHENIIPDPDFDPSDPAACTEIPDPNDPLDVECYRFWIGQVASDILYLNVASAVTTTADVSFNPDQWDVAWATGNSPPISVKISNIVGDGYNVGQIDVLSIKLNGTVGMIPDSEIVDMVNGALYVQFDRSDAVKSLGIVVPGIQKGAFVTGNIVKDDGVVIFSGESSVDIVENTGTEATDSAMHTVGCGPNPGSSKEPIVGMTIYVYDRSPGSCAAGIGTNWQNWETIVHGDATSDPCPVLYEQETFALGEAIFALPEGAYLMIGESIEPGDISPPHSDYIGRLVDVSPGIDDYQHFQVIKKCDGKTVAGKSRKFTGSELLLIEPEYVEWSSETELYPFVFDSVGDWTVTTSVTPPEGFVADNESLSAVVTNEVEAVQFTITDVGSKWVRTQVMHKIKHKKQKEITFTSDVGIKLTPELAQEKGISIWGEDHNDQGEDPNDDQNDDQKLGKGKKK